MVDSQVQNDLIKQLDQLSLPQQQRVLDYARSLSSPRAPVRGIPGRDLLEFAGTIDPDDCQAMIDAIESGCERVDPNEW